MFSQLLRADTSAPDELSGPRAAAAGRRSRVSSVPSHFENAHPSCPFHLSRWEMELADGALPSCLGRPVGASPLTQPRGSCPKLYLLTYFAADDLGRHAPLTYLHKQVVIRATGSSAIAAPSVSNGEMSSRNFPWALGFPF